jgi:hypothetical protein
MIISELKERIQSIEPQLASEPFVVAHTFVRDSRPFHVALTDRLRRRARKGRVWKSVEFLTALKNAEYGFDDSRARSRGGADGVFLLDRTFVPKNEMMYKIFDRYLDKAGSGVEAVASALDAQVSNLVAVRLVSHHLRLLGVLHRTTIADWLVLVDYDETK